jgi:hypothetical protein
MLSSVSVPWQLAFTLHVPRVSEPLTVIVIRSFCVPSLSAPRHVPVSVPRVAAEPVAAAVAMSTATTARRRSIRALSSLGVREDDRPPICPRCGVTMVPAALSAGKAGGRDWVCLECEELDEPD